LFINILLHTKFAGVIKLAKVEVLLLRDGTLRILISKKEGQSLILRKHE